MNKDWVLAYSSISEADVYLIKQMLENNNIESVILNKQDSVYKNLGEIELYVLRKDVVRAKARIQN